MNTAQLIVLWYAGLAIGGILLIRAVDESSAGYLIAAILLVTSLLLYTLKAHPHARKGRVILAVLLPPASLAAYLWYQGYAAERAQPLISHQEMWFSQAWLVGLAVVATAIVGAAFLFGVKAGCVYSERMIRRVGINPEWVASLDARRQMRDMMADNDDATTKELQAAAEKFEKNGGWTDVTLDGEAAQDVLRQLHDYFGRELAAGEMTDEAGRIGFRSRKAEVEKSGARED